MMAGKENPFLLYKIKTVVIFSGKLLAILLLTFLGWRKKWPFQRRWQWPPTNRVKKVTAAESPGKGSHPQNSTNRCPNNDGPGKIIAVIIFVCIGFATQKGGWRCATLTPMRCFHSSWRKSIWDTQVWGRSIGDRICYTKNLSYIKNQKQLEVLGWQTTVGY